MLGPQVGMGPIFWQKPENKIEKCSERHVDPCTDMDGCCAIVPCTYCLELMDVYGEKFYGTATFDGTQWTGLVNGYEFVAYWERGYESDICEFVVLFNVEYAGGEVFRSSCYEGSSCRDASGTVEVSADGMDYTLTWTKLERQPLKYVVDESGCKTWFCGTCECTCKVLCVTMIRPDGDTCVGLLPLEIYDETCPPDQITWTGTVACDYTSHTVSITLSRDDYTGGCILSGSFGADDLDPTEVSDCTGLVAMWILYDGTKIITQCLECSVCGGANIDGICAPCPEGTMYPYLVDITFPTLDLTVQSINSEDPGDESTGGWPYFGYRVEGDYGTNIGLLSFQSEFTICAYSLGFTGNPVPGGPYCADVYPNYTRKNDMDFLSCSPLILVIKGACIDPTGNVGIVPVIITGVV